MILDLHRQGLSVSAIARQLGVDRKTVRKYIARGLEPPRYGPRQPRPRQLDAFTAYLRQRVTAYPMLTGSRLWREVKELGYAGGYTAVTDYLRQVRPREPALFEVRFETPPGHQAQVDFAPFRVTSRMNRPHHAPCGCSRWCSATRAISGRALSCIRTCRRFCAVTSRLSAISAACRARSSMTA